MMATTKIAVLFVHIAVAACATTPPFPGTGAAPSAAACGTLQSSVPCGQPAVQPSTSRIVGGEEALMGSWPWLVLLIEGDFGVCGGAIINDRLILTAAHCFQEDVSIDPSMWSVQAGKHNLLKQDNGQMTFHVEQIILHENYNKTTVENDVAILVVRESIPYTTFIRPICLPSTSPETALYPGKACLMAGWGDTKGTGTQEVLNQVRVPVIADDVCSRPSWYYREFLPIKTFCAGYEEGLRDACSGDSGGPLISNFGNRWYVSGLASWGYGCAEPKWPGIYTNVTNYLPWIHAKRAAVCGSGSLIG